MTLTETIHSPSPMTQYMITGEYFQVRYSVSYKAELLNLVDSSYSTVTGKIQGSNITTSYSGNPPQHPNSIILIARPLEPKSSQAISATTEI